MPAAAEVRALERGHGSRRLRVLVLDDEELVHWGFRLLLGHQPWAERCLPARDDSSALDLARRFEPHVALIDYGALAAEPAAFLRDLSSVSSRTRALLLTQADAIPASTVHSLGAAGFLSRRWSASTMLRTIRFTGAGLSTIPRSPSDSDLTARQHEVLRFIADGATNAEIGARLYLSRHTVKQHTSALYRKLGVRNRTHAVQQAQRRGLI